MYCSIDFVIIQENVESTVPGTRGDGLLHLKNGVDYINPGEEDQMEIYG